MDIEYDYCSAPVEHRLYRAMDIQCPCAKVGHIIATALFSEVIEEFISRDKENGEVAVTTMFNYDLHRIFPSFKFIVTPKDRCKRESLMQTDRYLRWVYNWCMTKKVKILNEKQCKSKEV